MNLVVQSQRAGGALSQAKIRLGLALALLMVVLPGMMNAQAFLGSVVGTITDQSGAALPGVKVTVTNVGTNEERSATTSSVGDYQILNLVPGSYKLTADKDGFGRLVREGVTVRVQAELRVDAALSVGATTQSVEVSAQVAALETENAAVSTVVESQTVEGLSLNGRNVMNLIGLSNAVVPGSGALGATSSNQNGGSSTNFGLIGAYTIGGGMSNQSASLLDGAPLNINQYNATALVPNQDAVQEFRVVSNNVDAQFGRFAGGVVNFTTKSGTNAYHGSVYEFFRNNKLNANTFFNNLAGLERPQWNQNQYGGNIGGPIKKDKLFFFGAWENFDLRLQNPNVLTVPTDAMRAGDFSAPGLPTIYDPTTVCGVPGNNSGCPVVNGVVQYVRQPFQGNKIPLNRIDTAALYIQDGYAHANLPGTVNNYAVNQPAGSNQHQYTGRGDYNVSDKQQLYLRYSYWSVDNPASHPFQPPARSLDVGSEFKFQTQQAVIGDTYLLSPTTVLTPRISYMRNTNCSIPGAWQNLGLTNFGAGYVSLLNSGQLDGPEPPGTTIQNYPQGLDGFAVQCGRNNLYTISTDLTKTVGRHTVKFGGEIRDAQVNKWQVNPAGSFTYNNGFTAQNALSSAGSGLGYASFLLGLPASGSLKTSQVTANTEYYSGLYVMDTFQANRKLTITAGLRWDLPTSYTERYDRIGVFQPSVTNPLVPFNGAIGFVNSTGDAYRSVYAPHYKLFAPRLGLAYRITPTFVARLGYAIAYTPNDNNLPNTNTVNSATSTFVSSLNGGITPANIASNPFPTGVIPSPGRNATAAQKLFLGQTLSLPLQAMRYPYVQQWNVTLGKDLGHGMVAEASYAGLKGTFLPIGGNTNINQLPDQYNSMGQALLSQVQNPFAGIVTIGSLANGTVNAGQLLRVFPQYQNVGVEALNIGNSTYHSLQTHFQKNFTQGGTLMVNYTWSKELDNNGLLPVPGQAAPTGSNYIQDWNNISANKSLDPTNASQRMVFAYVYDLPFGKGKALFNGAPKVVNYIIGGWGLNGVLTVQSGQPLAITYGGTNVLNSTFGAGTIRPDVVAGCNKDVGGSWTDRFNAGKAFNTACFTAPNTFGFGNEAAVDPQLRGQGITNIDLGISRKFVITERFNLQFRVESYNLANHVRFANPTTVAGTPTFGQMLAGGTGQANNPRLIQAALRLNF